MATADEQIRVSKRTKRKLDELKREGESYEDVLARLLEGERDLLAGFGRWSSDHADRVRAARERYEKRSKERTERLPEDG
jgi:predicted CopG family antitoxin